MAKFDYKYICSKCGRKFTSWTGKCIACGSMEIDDFVGEEPKSGLKVDYNKKIVTKRASDVLNSKGEKFEVLETFDLFPGFNDILSTEGGILCSQIVLFAAAPGTGKTTLCTQISNEDTLFISTEETDKQVSQRFKRCNGNLDTQILESANEDEIISAIATTDCKLIILDSINSIENDNGGLISYQKVADITQKITHLVKSQRKAIIIISQVTKNNNIIGMESMVHAVDTVIHMERSTTSDKIILTSSKNRFAEVGEICFLKHEDNGLHEVPNECGNENAIGTTCFKMVSGSKKIPMEIQALIVPSDDKPIRRCVGINLNKLYLIDAILRSNDIHYNTRESDIYLATSNGLVLPEGNDIVIANSLLSSYYNIIINTNNDLSMFDGMLNLNGTIVGSKNFKHINDLIKLYHNERGVWNK